MESIRSLTEKLRTEADAYEYLERLRWGNRPICPHCGSVGKHYFLTPANGTSRTTRTGSQSQRRVWKCRDCRKQFSVLTGTIFHGTKISVRMWVLVIFEMCSSKNGVAAKEIERKYGVNSKTAWFMLHRIREAMKREPLAGLLSGRVVADETWIGGKPRNRHGGAQPQGGVWKRTEKVPVLALMITDYSGSYQAKAARMGDFASHQWVDHQAGEYARGYVSTNSAENYFSQLKRSLDGTHHHVSVEHLPRYLAEFDFRYSTRKMTDTERMQRLLGKVHARRLTYRPTA